MHQGRTMTVRTAWRRSKLLFPNATGCHRCRGYRWHWSGGRRHRSTRPLPPSTHRDGYFLLQIAQCSEATTADPTGGVAAAMGYAAGSPLWRWHVGTAADALARESLACIVATSLRDRDCCFPSTWQRNQNERALPAPCCHGHTRLTCIAPGKHDLTWPLIVKCARRGTRADGLLQAASTSLGRVGSWQAAAANRPISHAKQKPKRQRRNHEAMKPDSRRASRVGEPERVSGADL